MGRRLFLLGRSGPQMIARSRTRGVIQGSGPARRGCGRGDRPGVEGAPTGRARGSPDNAAQLWPRPRGVSGAGPSSCRRHARGDARLFPGNRAGRRRNRHSDHNSRCWSSGEWQEMPSTESGSARFETFSRLPSPSSIWPTLRWLSDLSHSAARSRFAVWQLRRTGRTIAIDLRTARVVIVPSGVLKSRI